MPGYVIATNGDSVRGLIDYRAWSRSPSAISFKHMTESDEVAYTPLEIREFAVSGRSYAGAIITVEDVDFQNRNIKTAEGKFRSHPDTVFLEALMSGQKALYVYQDGSGRKQFYITKDSQFEPLVYHASIEERATANVFVESNVFKTQLYDYFADCPAIRAKLKTLKYDQRDLEKLFLSYFGCTNTTVAHKRVKPNRKIDWGVMAGFTATKLDFRSDITNYQFLTDANFKGGATASAGLFAGLLLPGNLEKFRVAAELMYTSYHMVADPVRIYDNSHYNNSTIYTTRIGEKTVKLNLLLRYAYPIGKASVFVGGGMTLQAAKLTDNTVHTVDYRGDVQETSADLNALNYNHSIQWGFIGNFGVSFSRFSLEGRFDRTDGVFGNTVIVSHINRSSVLLSYRIF